MRGGRGPQFRPTAQVVRGSVFDTLGESVSGASVLDLFAGSGAFGIEALSRGAARAVFVEQDLAILRALRANLERCRVAQQAAVVRGDAMRFLERLIRGGDAFDIIFADPPYISGLCAKVAAMIGASSRRICRTLITESDGQVEVAPGGELVKTRTRTFGQTIITYFEYRPDATAGAHAKERG